jgi:hypothetical protein
LDEDVVAISKDFALMVQINTTPSVLPVCSMKTRSQPHPAPLHAWRGGKSFAELFLPFCELSVILNEVKKLFFKENHTIKGVVNIISNHI